MSRQINLYDASLRQQKDWLTSRNLALASLLAVLVVSLGAAAASWSVASRTLQAESVNTQLKAARAAFSSMTSSLASRKADPALALEVKETELGLKTAQRALGLLRGMTTAQERPVVGEMMSAFSRASVDGLWLIGFVVSENGQQLEIRGRMSDQALLPGYLRYLESEPVFQGRRFASLDMQGATWQPLVQPATQSVAAVDPKISAENKPEPWFVEFALRTTDIPKAAVNGGVRR